MLMTKEGQYGGWYEDIWTLGSYSKPYQPSRLWIICLGLNHPWASVLSLIKWLRDYKEEVASTYVEHVNEMCAWWHVSGCNLCSAPTSKGYILSVLNLVAVNLQKKPVLCCYLLAGTHLVMGHGLWRQCWNYLLWNQLKLSLMHE